MIISSAPVRIPASELHFTYKNSRVTYVGLQPKWPELHHCMINCSERLVGRTSLCPAPSIGCQHSTATFAAERHAAAPLLL